MSGSGYPPPSAPFYGDPGDHFTYTNGIPSASQQDHSPLYYPPPQQYQPAPGPPAQNYNGTQDYQYQHLQPRYTDQPQYLPQPHQQQQHRAHPQYHSSTNYDQPLQPHIPNSSVQYHQVQASEQPRYPPFEPITATATQPPLQHPAPVPTTLNPAFLRETPSTHTQRLKLKFKLPSPEAQSPAEAEGMDTRRRPTTQVKVEEQVSFSGRPVRGTRALAEQKITSQFAAESDDEDAFDDPDGEGEILPAVNTRRTSRQNAGRSAEKFEEHLFEAAARQVSPRRTSGRMKKRVVDPDDDEEEEQLVQPARNAFPSANVRATRQQNDAAASVERPSKGKSRHSSADEEEFEPPASELTEEDDDGSDDPIGDDYGTPSGEDDLNSWDDGRRRSRRVSRPRPKPQPARRSTRNSNRRMDSDDEYGRPTRQLRERTSKVNYELPPLDISAELRQDAIANVAGSSRRRGVGFANGTRFGAAGGKGFPYSLPQAMGDMDSSDSDMDLMAPLKAAGASGMTGPAAVGAAPGPRVGGPADVPNYGRINPKSNLADADPLGVDMNVTFDNVGGLDGREYKSTERDGRFASLIPELFQKFGLTPPRGVLFHGPPGTGKTLLARALAASCSTGNTKIAFFMRKGADVLSKWVGEAERQLRMLFEEARASQPSIIFFDEIDGLAPVRSSKQDQIHASLVSTLLALMDGMDGRGQVIVIGATNRPDAVDSALRRPGRFDREFYFPLPNREARRKIIQINTREWSPALPDPLLDKLSMMTKGYGGADLRALCTEAALNAIQRRYPQIYQSTDRLLLDHGSISVGAKDFMMSVKKITPSSARSTASAASQLPTHLVPLLEGPLERLKTAVDRVLPRHKLPTALEEAEFVDDIGDDLEKHMMVQSLDKLRTFRPRVLLHGPTGMGQTYLGPAILHHLEGFHIQSLDIGTLMADSTRTPEATLVQLFVEAKRHQPSILFIPSLLSWSLTLSESARMTFSSLLDGIPSFDPVLLLAIVEQPYSELPRDIKSWFGASKESRVPLVPPFEVERAEYFASLTEAFHRPPSDFPDALPRQKRILEILPPAPPLPLRKPTEAEIQRELEKDQSARNMMILSFTSLVQEFLKKFRKVVAGVKEDAMLVSEMLANEAAVAAAGVVAAAVDLPAIAAGAIQVDALPNGHGPLQPEHMELPSASAPAALETPAVPLLDVPATAAEAVPPKPVWQAHDIDIDTIHRKLLRNKYFTPTDFLADITKIEDNAAHTGDADRQARVAEMAANARVHVSHFDPKWTPEFERYKERMRVRKEEREIAKAKEKGAGAESSTVNDHPPTGETETPTDIGNGQLPDATLKRAREDGVEGERDGKRMREDETEVDDSSTSASQSTLMPGPLTDLVAGAISSVPAITAATVPEPRSPPLPVYPPFVLPSDLWSTLEQLLIQRTAGLSVDELEQIRARCFDRLWRRRGYWDRTEVVGECLNWVAQHVEEIEEMRRDEENQSLE